MDRVTQQNASLVEESASAAAALEEQAARLNQTVAVFKVSRRMARKRLIRPTRNYRVGRISAAPFGTLWLWNHDDARFLRLGSDGHHHTDNQ